MAIVYDSKYKMPQHIKIETVFDITNTGITRNFRNGVVPVRINNIEIKTEEEWIKLRRQQSNWETFIQIISLRVQPLNIITYTKDSLWVIEFDIDQTGVFESNGDNIGLLKLDFMNVPVVTGLDDKTSEQFIIPDKNTRFESYDI